MNRTIGLYDHTLQTDPPGVEKRPLKWNPPTTNPKDCKKRKAKQYMQEQTKETWKRGLERGQGTDCESMMCCFTEALRFRQSKTGNKDVGMWTGGRSRERERVLKNGGDRSFQAWKTKNVCYSNITKVHQKYSQK